MNKTLENQIQTEEKKHKHKKFLLLFLLLLLFLSSVGALSFVFIRILSPNTTKIDIKTIFEDDTSH
jgi:flagellar basal body-associated protein FliL